MRTLFTLGRLFVEDHIFLKILILFDRIGPNLPKSARIGRNWAELFTLGRLFVEEPCDEALIPVDCRLCSEVIEFDLLEPPAPSSSFISDTLTSEKKIVKLQH